MNPQSNRSERIMSLMVWANLAAAALTSTIAGLLIYGGVSAGGFSLERGALSAMFLVWGSSLGIGVWRFFRNPGRATAREIALMTSLLFGGILIAGGVRGLLLGRRVPMPVALGLVAFSLVAIWIVYRFFLRRCADEVYRDNRYN